MRNRPGPIDDLPETPATQDLEVPPTAVGPPRARRRAVMVLLAIAAAIAAAGVLAQLPADPATPSPPPVRARVALPATPGPVVRPDPTTSPTSSSGSPRALPPRLSRENLRDRVLAGGLDGRLVFVDGALRVTPVRCRSLAQARSRCVDLVIPGLGLPVWAGVPALPWRDDPPPGAWLVTVARAGGLVYLGSLLPELRVPSAIGTLTRRWLAREPVEPTGTLFQIDGWLVADPSRTCNRPGVVATPCPARPPFLAADEPRPDGALRSERGGPVALASPSVDVDATRPVVAGRFLVTAAGCDPAGSGSCDGEPRWLLVARYEPGRSIRVLVP